MSVVAGGRRYRFPPLVRTGLFGAMPGTQLAVLGVGGGLSFVGTVAGLTPWSLVPLAGGLVLGFARRDGVAIHESFPRRVRWRIRRRSHRWLRPIPLIGADPTGRSYPLPSVLVGLELLEADPAWVRAVSHRVAGVAVIHDRTAGTMSGVLRVQGDGRFALAAADDQDHRVGLWGDALAWFCREQCPVNRIVWHEWATTTPLTPTPSTTTPSPTTPPPTTLSATTLSTTMAPTGGPNRVDATGETTGEALVRRAGGGERTGGIHAGVAAAQAAYRELVHRAAPMATVHEVLVVVSVELSRLSRHHTRARAAAVAAVEVLMEEVRLFSARLDAAGLHVDAPLSPVELTTAVRARSDPRVVGRRDGLARSLAELVGVGIGELAPMAVVEDFDRVQVDGSWHRSWWIEHWPRLDVPAAWMHRLFNQTRSTRTITLVFEPIPPSTAARNVDEAAVALESANAAKAKRGFRVRASDRRARDEIERREQELVAGYGDLAYAGFITVTTPTSDGIDTASADIEQTAAHVGLQLRPLDARHAAGWALSIPVGRTVTSRR